MWFLGILIKLEFHPTLLDQSPTRLHLLQQSPAKMQLCINHPSKPSPAVWPNPLRIQTRTILMIFLHLRRLFHLHLLQISRQFPPDGPSSPCIGSRMSLSQKRLQAWPKVLSLESMFLLRLTDLWRIWRPVSMCLSIHEQGQESNRPQSSPSLSTFSRRSMREFCFDVQNNFLDRDLFRRWKSLLFCLDLDVMDKLCSKL